MFQLHRAGLERRLLQRSWVRLFSLEKSVNLARSIPVNSTQFSERILSPFDLLPQHELGPLHDQVVQLTLQSPDLNTIKNNLLVKILLCQHEHGNAGFDRTIFKVFQQNTSCEFNVSLIEQYLMCLLRNNNISAATMFLHIILDQLPNFHVSNELWSLFLTKTCENSHYGGATLIYNEIIDNFRYYEMCTGANPNNMVPFLVTTTALIQMSIIFSNNGDLLAILGLQNYFKRFYSYNIHWRVHVELRACEIETASKLDVLDVSLQKFNRLCHHTWRRTRNLATPKYLAKQVSESHAEFRNRSIVENSRCADEVPVDLRSGNDFEQLKLTDEQLFRPLEEYNSYFSGNKPRVHVLPDLLTLEDFINFKELLGKEISKMPISSRIDNLKVLLNQNHFLLHTVVIAALCDLGLFPDAQILLIELRKVYSHKLSIKDLHSPDLFVYVMKSILDSIESHSSNIDSQLSLSTEMLDLYLTRTARHTNDSFKVYSYWLQAQLLNSGRSFTIITNYLDMLVAKSSSVSNPTVFLERKAYDKFKSICLRNSAEDYLKFIGKLAY